MLAIELFDKSSAGVVLTREGEAVVTYARRLLSLNDQILQVATPAPSARTLRVGVSGDYVATFLPRAFARFRRHAAYRKLHVTATMNNEKLLHDLRTGDLDIVLVWTGDRPEVDARHHWIEDLVWARSPSRALDPGEPVPLVSRGDEWLNHRLAVSALERAGRSYEVVFVGPTILSLLTAVREGLGVMPFGRRRVLHTDLHICDEAELPKLPAVGCSIYVSDVGDTEALHALADAVADVMKPRIFLAVEIRSRPMGARCSIVFSIRPIRFPPSFGKIWVVVSRPAVLRDASLRSRASERLNRSDIVLEEPGASFAIRPLVRDASAARSLPHHVGGRSQPFAALCDLAPLSCPVPAPPATTTYIFV